MVEKRDRDPWDDRYGDDDEDIETSQTSETEESSKMQETSKTSKSSKTAKSKQTSKSTVRDRKNVNMYLPDDLVGDLQLRYSELNVDWRRKYDDDMPKNQEFYPAVIRAALEETTIREELDLD
jgi:hypothetical protein